MVYLLKIRHRTGKISCSPEPPKGSAPLIFLALGMLLVLCQCTTAVRKSEIDWRLRYSEAVARTQRDRERFRLPSSYPVSDSAKALVTFRARREFDTRKTATNSRASTIVDVILDGEVYLVKFIDTELHIDGGCDCIIALDRRTLAFIDMTCSCSP